MQIIYPDTSIVKSLSDKPEVWNSFYDQFIEKFGRRFKCFQSYYLFFEYLGFTKKLLDIPPHFLQPQFNNLSQIIKINQNLHRLNEQDIYILDKNLADIELDIATHIYDKLYFLKLTFKTLREERNKRTSTFKASQQIIDSLFGNINNLIDYDFDLFAKYATTFLAWDIFCGINPIGLPIKAIRERQLGFWFQRWEKGIKLPFGKIIDDQSDYYSMEFTSRFKGFEDMVDSEMHTFLILGYEIDNQVRPINCITHPPKDQNAISKRNELALGCVTNIQTTLGKEMPKFPGKIYTLDRATHQIIEINEPMFSISL